jgi:hypothetical protein
MNFFESIVGSQWSVAPTSERVLKTTDCYLLTTYSHQTK